jgi:hypothetical protein
VGEVIWAVPRKEPGSDQGARPHRVEKLRRLDHTVSYGLVRLGSCTAVDQVLLGEDVWGVRSSAGDQELARVSFRCSSVLTPRPTMAHSKHACGRFDASGE